MPGSDPSHWLHRLSAAEWLAAAEHELVACDEALGRRSYRPAVTHARRAAGMALNAVLVQRPEKVDGWGRSYMEHVVALATDADAPSGVKAAAELLRATPPAPPSLVTIGAPDRTTLRAAEAILVWSREISAPKVDTDDELNG